MGRAAVADVGAMRRAFGAEGLVTFALVSAKIGMHLALSSRYGWHRDEYYFVDCGRHLAFGYVDHAPLVPWIAAAATSVFGHNLTMLRLPSILAGGATVWLTIKASRRFGAGVYGQALAGASVVFAPAFLRMHGMLDIPAFEPLFWLGGALLAMDLIDGRSKRRWLLLGVVAGVGLLNKHTMLLWAAGMAVGVLATPMRGDLKTRWPWLGAAIALAIFSPNLYWQAQHDWATLEFIRIMGDTVLAAIPRHLFLLGQVLYLGPVAVVVWASGLVYLFTEPGRRYRLLGIMYLTVMALLFFMHAKPYYSAPAYPILFAAGGAQLEAWLAGRTRLRGAFNLAFVATGLVLGSATLPLFALPKVDAGFDRALGWIVRPVDLTHDMHDELGWPEQATAVAEVFAALPEDERRNATIFTDNYGQASALNVHGAAYGLPRATSGHMTHYLWGPDETKRDPIILVGVKDETRASMCTGAKLAGRITHELAMEANVPIHVCEPRRPLGSSWPALKRYRHGTGD